MNEKFFFLGKNSKEIQEGIKNEDECISRSNPIAAVAVYPDECRRLLVIGKYLTSRVVKLLGR